MNRPVVRMPDPIYANSALAARRPGTPSVDFDLPSHNQPLLGVLVAGLAPGVKKLRGGARERSLSFIFVLITLLLVVLPGTAVLSAAAVGLAPDVKFLCGKAQLYFTF